MAQISIDLEEYKELLTVKIRREFEEEIQNLKLELQEKTNNSEYWWKEWHTLKCENRELQAKIEELTKDGDCDAA